MPGTRNVQPRASAGVLELAVALKKGNQARTAAQVHRILAARLGAGQVPWVRTIQRHFVRMELAGLPGGAAAPEVFGRFEAAAPGRAVGLRRAAPPARPARRPRPTCSASRTTIPGSSPAGGGPPARMSPGCSPRCGGRWRRTAPRGPSTSITAARMCPGSCCMPWPSWASRSPTRGPADPRGREKSNAYSRQCGLSSWSRWPAMAGERGHHAGVGNRAGGAVRRLGAPGVSPGGPRRDRSGPGRAVRSRDVPAPADRPAGDRRGVLVAGLPHRHQDRHDQPAREPVPDRPGAGRPQGRGALQPGRPDHRDPGAVARERRWARRCRT